MSFLNTNRLSVKYLKLIEPQSTCLFNANDALIFTGIIPKNKAKKSKNYCLHVLYQHVLLEQDFYNLTLKKKNHRRHSEESTSGFKRFQISLSSRCLQFTEINFYDENAQGGKKKSKPSSLKSQQNILKHADYFCM